MDLYQKNAKCKKADFDQKTKIFSKNQYIVHLSFQDPLFSFKESEKFIQQILTNKKF